MPPALLTRLVELWHPQEIWLFGSRARGTARPESDWDILLVLPDQASEEMLDPHQAWLRVRDLRIPTDILSMRRSEFEEQRRLFGSLAHLVVRDGAKINAA